MNNEWLQNVISFYNWLIEKLVPRILVRDDNGVLSYHVFRKGQWQRHDAVPEQQSVFEQRIFLVADEHCFFRCRQFPTDTVSRDNLREAVELDLTRWSPISEDYDLFYWPQKKGDQWQVGVWVWSIRDVQTTIAQTQPAPGYVLPVTAWKLVALSGANPRDLVLIQRSPAGGWQYAGVNTSLQQPFVTQVMNEKDDRRFQTSFLASLQDPVIRLDDELTSLPFDWDTDVAPGPAVYQPARMADLDTARQAAVKNWVDPFTWARPIGALLSVYVFYVLLSGLLSLKHSYELESHTARADAVSAGVLDAREEVDRVNQALEAIDKLRLQQDEMQRALAALSEALPADTWLQHADYRLDPVRNSLEITGSATSSAALAALLEKRPEFDEVLFLTDIRTDRRTGNETFKLQLILQEGAHAARDE